jgi:hypothetical protein
MDPSCQEPAGSVPKKHFQDIREDTKLWLHDLWGTEKEKCAEDLKVSIDELSAWYKGDKTDPKFTLLLRNRIKEIKDARGIKNKPTVAVDPVATTGAVVPVATTGAETMLAGNTKQPQSRVKMSPVLKTVKKTRTLGELLQNFGPDTSSGHLLEIQNTLGLRYTEEEFRAELTDMQTKAKTHGKNFVLEVILRVWRDTKARVDELWKDKAQCLKDLEMSAEDFDRWYKNGDGFAKFDLHIRSRIEKIQTEREKNQGNGSHPTVNAVPPAVSSVTTVSTGEQCTACRGKHDRHVCGKQKDSGQQMRSAPSVVANSGRKPRPPSVPHTTLWKRVADLEGIVQSLTAELQLVKNQQTELLGDNKNLLNLAASVISLNAMLLPPLNNQPAPSQPMQEDSEDQRALKKMRT